MLSIDGVSGVHSDLVVNREKSGGGIYEDRGSVVFVVHGFPPSSVEESSRSGRDELVTEGEHAWLGLICLQRANDFGILGDGGSFIWSAHLSSVFAGLTHWSISRCELGKSMGDGVKVPSLGQLLDESERWMA